MAETLRIEIPIETVDNTDPGVSNATKKFEKMERAANSANSSAKKASDTVSKFDKQAQKTEKSLASWAKEKYEVLLEAKERISPVLSTLGNGLRGFAGKTWSVTMRAIDLITSPVRGIINLLKNPIFQVGAVLGVSIGLKDTIETYKDFEAAMSQVQAISGATSTELVKLTNKAKEMGATTKFTAEESAQAFNYMAMAGWKTDDMLNGIEGILSLAAASGEDLATTSDIVTDALTAFNMKAGDAGHFSDVLAAAASNANTTVSGMGETFKYAGSMAGSLSYSMGYTDEQIAQLREPDFCGRIGFPDYMLANNNANIRRLEGRIKSLQKTKSQGTQESENKFFKVKENVEAMRIQLFFEGKPEPEVRDILKSNGFRWAPSVGAWQRQLNNNGKYAVERVIRELEEMEAAE